MICYNNQLKSNPMASFNKSDLQHNHYNWSNKSQQDFEKIRGFHDDASLTKTEGYEVLPYINRYMNYRSWKLITSFHKIENAIINELPNDIKLHSTVKKWLDQNV
jgi:hypothetical protein